MRLPTPSSTPPSMPPSSWGILEEEGIDLTLVNGAGADKVMTAWYPGVRTSVSWIWGEYLYLYPGRWWLRRKLRPAHPALGTSSLDGHRKLISSGKTSLGRSFPFLYSSDSISFLSTSSAWMWRGFSEFGSNFMVILFSVIFFNIAKIILFLSKKYEKILLFYF